MLPLGRIQTQREEQIRGYFDQLPIPVQRWDEDGEIYRQGWIFRGHKKESYLLKPSIEREYPTTDWDEVCR